MQMFCQIVTNSLHPSRQRRRQPYFLILFLYIFLTTKLVLAQTSQTTPSQSSPSVVLAGVGKPCSADVECETGLLCDCPPESEKLSSATSSRTSLVAGTLACSTIIFTASPSPSLVSGAAFGGCLFSFCGNKIGVFGDNRARLCPEKSGVCKQPFGTVALQPPKKNYDIIINNSTTNATATPSPALRSPSPVISTTSPTVPSPTAPSPTATSPTTPSPVPCPTGTLATCIAGCNPTSPIYASCVSNCVALCS